MAKVIRSFREFKKYKKIDLAKRSHVSCRYISETEGQKIKVSPEALEKISKGLGTSSDDIFLDIFSNIPGNENKKITPENRNRIIQKIKTSYFQSP